MFTKNHFHFAPFMNELQGTGLIKVSIGRNGLHHLRVPTSISGMLIPKKNIMKK